MLPLGVIHPVFSFIRASVGARVFSRLGRSRKINLTVPSGRCPGLLFYVMFSSAFRFTSGCGLLPSLCVLLPLLSGSMSLCRCTWSENVSCSMYFAVFCLLDSCSPSQFISWVKSSSNTLFRQPVPRKSILHICLFVLRV